MGELVVAFIPDDDDDSGDVVALEIDDDGKIPPPPPARDRLSIIALGGSSRVYRLPNSSCVLVVSFYVE